jgi:release factor glutamine methyltransferase
LYLSDISNEALNIAKKNSELLGLDANLLLGDMLNPFIENNIKCDVIVCNPPYIQDVSTIDKKTWEQEPHLALLANPDTLFYEKVLKDYQKIINNKYLLAFEIGENMKESLKPLIKKYCPDADYSFEKDIYGKTRFLFIKKDI